MHLHVNFFNNFNVCIYIYIYINSMLKKRRINYSFKYYNQFKNFKSQSNMLTNRWNLKQIIKKKGQIVEFFFFWLKEGLLKFYSKGLTRLAIFWVHRVFCQKMIISLWNWLISWFRLNITNVTVYWLSRHLVRQKNLVK